MSGAYKLKLTMIESEDGNQTEPVTLFDSFQINRTVQIRLHGGLGNQMFQYAAALGLAVRQSREVMLDVSAFKQYEARPYQLDRLKVPQDLSTGSPSLGSAYANSFVARLIRKIRRDYILRKDSYREPAFHFDPAIFDLSSDKVLLEGYFQSPYYFIGAEELLRERFQLKASMTALGAKWAEKISSSACSISIHLRRGDYLTQTASAVHATLTQDYYDRAVSLMLDLIGSEVDFFLFSDEPDVISKVFAHLPRAYVVQSDPAAPWEDMFLMARCHHNIIANSSYSWWGAWLNQAKGKRVIAPAGWFTSQRLATCNVMDLYPDDWILLK